MSMVTNPPDNIYLQYGNDCGPVDHSDCAEVSWCKDRIFDSDVAYFRADLLQDADVVYTNMNVGKISVPPWLIMRLHPKCRSCRHLNETGYCNWKKHRVEIHHYCPEHTAFDNPQTEEKP